MTFNIGGMMGNVVIEYSNQIIIMFIPSSDGYNFESYEYDDLNAVYQMNINDYGTDYGTIKINSDMICIMFSIFTDDEYVTRIRCKDCDRVIRDLAAGKFTGCLDCYKVTVEEQEYLENVIS